MAAAAAMLPTPSLELAAFGAEDQQAKSDISGVSGWASPPTVNLHAPAMPDRPRRGSTPSVCSSIRVSFPRACVSHAAGHVHASTHPRSIRCLSGPPRPAQHDTEAQWLDQPGQSMSDDAQYWTQRSAAAMAAATQVSVSEQQHQRRRSGSICRWMQRRAYFAERRRSCRWLDAAGLQRRRWGHNT